MTTNPLADRSASLNFRTRWLVLGVFLVSSILNYLDRLTLAHLAPVLEREFGFSHQQYGYLLSFFALIYALSSPLAGSLIDRIGLNRGMSFAVGIWSAASVATGFVTGFGGLLACRGVLAASESAGVPGVGKAISRFLPPRERALGQAASNFGLGIGAMLAPLASTALLLAVGWQAAFILPGVLGFLWIPVWLSVERRFAGETVSDQAEGPPAPVLTDRRMWFVIAANILAMAPYTLWSNWTTILLVESHGLTIGGAAGFAAIPPLMANLGGFAGGYLSLRLMRSGASALESRWRACLGAAILSLATSFIPLAPSVWWSTAGIGISFFAAAAFSVNLYSVPLDLYGVARAAFATSLLTSAYGVTQGVFSPIFGGMAERWGFAPICLLTAILPFSAALLLRAGIGERHA